MTSIMNLLVLKNAKNISKLVLKNAENISKLESIACTDKHTYSRKRQKETLRKVRGPWLFICPVSAPSTLKGTVAAAPKSFWPDHSIA